MRQTAGEPAAKPPEQEVKSMDERLANLDRKLDRLASQMETCLGGIQGLNAKVMVAEPSGKCVSIEHLAHMSERSQTSESHQTRSPKCSDRRRSSLISSFDIGMGRCNAKVPLTPGGYRRNFDIFMQNRQRKLTPHEQLVWRFLSDPESGLAARVYNRLNPAFILLVVVFSLIQTTPLAIANPKLAMVIECAIEALFLLEISLLFVVCPSRWHFFRRSYNIIDIVSVMPLLLRLYCIVTENSQEIYVIIFGGFVPVVRLLKTLRRFQTFRLLTSAFLLAGEAVPVLIFFYSLVWLLFSAIVFAVEDRSNIKTAPDAMWLAFVSMTTLGYGDVVPKSGAGRAVVACLVMISCLYMAIPLGIIGSCFSAVWADRDCILLFERLRSCFMEIGCSHGDVPHLFSMFDKTKTGSLDALEFIDMASHLKLGLSEDRLMRLFKLWANEESSRIEAAAFQMSLFPQSCVKELAKNRQDEARFNAMRRSTSLVDPGCLEVNHADGE